jgi:hypothetical protein
MISSGEIHNFSIILYFPKTTGSSSSVGKCLMDCCQRYRNAACQRRGQMFIGLFWILLSSSLFAIGLLMGAAAILVVVHFFSGRTKTNRLARM